MRKSRFIEAQIIGDYIDDMMATVLSLISSKIAVTRYCMAIEMIVRAE